MQPRFLAYLLMYFNPQNACSPSLEPTHRYHLHSPTLEVVQLVLAVVKSREKTAHKRPHTQHHFTDLQYVVHRNKATPKATHRAAYYPITGHEGSHIPCMVARIQGTGEMHIPALSHQSVRRNRYSSHAVHLTPWQLSRKGQRKLDNLKRPLPTYLMQQSAPLEHLLLFSDYKGNLENQLRCRHPGSRDTKPA